MQIKNYIKVQRPFLALVSIAFVLSSCGSYQYVGEENDGIYGSSEEPIEARTNVAEDNDNNNSFYKNYFKEKATEYDYIPDENEVFTDIDSYDGEYVEQESTEQESYAGWGQENSNVSINVYGGGGFAGWGYNSWWYRPYGYGGFSPFWYYGWSWGYSGFYDPFWCSPYGYGGFYGNPYYYGYYGYYNNPYYGRNNVAYHNSRRGSSLGRINNLGRRNNINGMTRDYGTRPSYSSQPRRGNSPNTSEPRPRSNNTVIPKPRYNPKTNTSTPRPRTNTSTPRPTRSNTYSPRPSTYSSSPRPSGNTSSPSRGGRR